MSTNKRGVVKKISFEIEYPDGSTKTSVLEEKELDNLAAIVLSEEAKVGKAELQWNKSAEWKENPTMFLISRDLKSTPYCRWKWHLAKWESENAAKE